MSSKSGSSNKSKSGSGSSSVSAASRQQQASGDATEVCVQPPTQVTVNTPFDYPVVVRAQINSPNTAASDFQAFAYLTDEYGRVIEDLSAGGLSGQITATGQTLEDDNNTIGGSSSGGNSSRGSGGGSGSGSDSSNNSGSASAYFAFPGLQVSVTGMQNIRIRVFMMDAAGITTYCEATTTEFDAVNQALSPRQPSPEELAILQRLRWATA